MSDQIIINLTNGSILTINKNSVEIESIKANLPNILKKDLINICNEFNILYRKSWPNKKIHKCIEDYLDKSIESDVNESDVNVSDVNESNGIKYLDLCAGCGGIALGFRNTNLYNPIEFIEIDKKCCETLLANNFPEDTINCSDITKVDFSNEIYKNVELVVAGSPCQAFSMSGLKKGFRDPRGAILFTIIDMLDIIKPPMFLIENVEGLLHHENSNSIKLLLKEFKKKGYFVKYKLLNSVNYGVPQTRKRLFIFGSRKNNNFTFPEPNNTILTVSDAILDLEDSTENIITQTYNERKLKYFHKIPQGGCWINLPIDDQKDYLGNSFNSGGGKRGILRRLSYSKPSLTIICSPQQKQTERCHPTKNRPLTILESARIQTFPDSYKFCGSNVSKYKQIGNAVPVKLAETMANAIALYWNANKLLDDDILSEPDEPDAADEPDEPDAADAADEPDEPDEPDATDEPDEPDEPDEKNMCVNFVSQHIFKSLCDEVIYKYNEYYNKSSTNIDDKFKMAFDMHVHKISKEQWLQRDRIRQLDKSINNDIGYFHQKLLGSVKGWINLDNDKILQSKYNVDLCNLEQNIFIELKNKYNTMNSSSTRDVTRRLNNIKIIHPDAKLYIGIIIGKTETQIIKQKNNISYIYGNKLYELITGDKYAYDNTLKSMNALLC